MTRSTYEGRWLTTKQMSEVLGKHPLTLVRMAKKLVKDGVLEEGKHFTKSKMGLNYGEMQDITKRL